MNQRKKDLIRGSVVLLLIFSLNLAASRALEHYRPSETGFENKEQQTLTASGDAILDAIQRKDRAVSSAYADLAPALQAYSASYRDLEEKQTLTARLFPTENTLTAADASALADQKRQLSTAFHVLTIRYLKDRLQTREVTLPADLEVLRASGLDIANDNADGSVYQLRLKPGQQAVWIDGWLWFERARDLHFEEPEMLLIRTPEGNWLLPDIVEQELVLSEKQLGVWTKDWTLSVQGSCQEAYATSLDEDL